MLFVFNQEQHRSRQLCRSRCSLVKLSWAYRFLYIYPWWWNSLFIFFTQMKSKSGAEEHRVQKLWPGNATAHWLQAHQCQPNRILCTTALTTWPSQPVSSWKRASIFFTLLITSNTRITTEDRTPQPPPSHKPLLLLFWIFIMLFPLSPWLLYLWSKWVTLKPPLPQCE